MNMTERNVEDSNNTRNLSILSPSKKKFKRNNKNMKNFSKNEFPRNKFINPYAQQRKKFAAAAPVKESTNQNNGLRNKQQSTGTEDAVTAKNQNQGNFSIRSGDGDSQSTNNDTINEKSIRNAVRNHPEFSGIFTRKAKRFQKSVKHQMKKMKARQMKQKRLSAGSVTTTTVAKKEIILIESSDDGDDDDVVEIKLPSPPMVTIEDSDDENESLVKKENLENINNSLDVVQTDETQETNLDDFIENADRYRLLQEENDSENAIDNEDLIHEDSPIENVEIPDADCNNSNDVFLSPQKRTKKKQMTNNDYQVTQPNFRALDVYESESSDMPESVYAKGRNKGPSKGISSSDDIEEIDIDIETTQKTKKLRKRRITNNRGSDINDDSEVDEEMEKENENDNNDGNNTTALPFISRGEAVENCKKKFSINRKKRTRSLEKSTIIQSNKTSNEDGNETDVSNRSDDEEDDEESITARKIAEEVISKRLNASSHQGATKQVILPSAAAVDEGIEELSDVEEDVIMQEDENIINNERHIQNKRIKVEDAIPVTHKLNHFLEIIDQLQKKSDDDDDDDDGNLNDDDEIDVEFDDANDWFADYEMSQDQINDSNGNDDDNNEEQCSIKGMNKTTNGNDKYLNVVHSNTNNHIGWNDEMTRFYDKSWGGEKFCLNNIWKFMRFGGGAQSNWRINNNDRILRKFSRKFRCFNCNEFGHFESRCARPKKRFVCHMCGENGHNSSNCPSTICLLCGAKAYKFELGCSSCRVQRRLVCPICKIKGHSIDYCPDKWRRYHSTIIPNECPNKNVVYQKRKFCCVCHSVGHLGEECKKYQGDILYPPILSQIQSHAKSYQDIPLTYTIAPNVIAYNLFYEPNDLIRFNFSTNSTKLTNRHYYWRFLDAVGLRHILLKKRELPKIKAIENDNKSDKNQNHQNETEEEPLNKKSRDSENTDENNKNLRVEKKFLFEVNNMKIVEDKNGSNNSILKLKSANPLLRKVLKKNFENQSKNLVKLMKSMGNENETEKQKPNEEEKSYSKIIEEEPSKEVVQEEELQNIEDELDIEKEEAVHEVDVESLDENEEGKESEESVNAGTHEDVQEVKEDEPMIDVETNEEEDGETVESDKELDHQKDDETRTVENENKKIVNEENDVEIDENIIVVDDNIDDCDENTTERMTQESLEQPKLTVKVKSEEQTTVVETIDCDEIESEDNDTNFDDDEDIDNDDDEEEEEEEEMIPERKSDENENDDSESVEPPPEFLMNVVIPNQSLTSSKDGESLDKEMIEEQEEISQLPDFIPLTTIDEISDENMNTDNPVGISHRLSGRNYEGECTNFIADRDMPGSVKIHLTNFHGKYLLSAEGQKFLITISKKHNIKTKISWTTEGNILIMNGLPKDRVGFHTDLLLAFRNISELPNFDSSKYSVIPKNRLKLIRFIQKEILKLNYNLGNVFSIFKRFPSLSIKNKYPSSKYDCKVIRDGRRTLNMILFGQIGLEYGRQYLRNLTNYLKILQENDYEIVPDDIHKEIYKHWKYIFSSHLHENTKKLFEDYFRTTKRNAVPKFNLIKVLGKNAIYVNFTRKYTKGQPPPPPSMVMKSANQGSPLNSGKNNKHVVFNPFSLYRGMIPGIVKKIDYSNTSKENKEEEQQQQQKDSQQEKDSGMNSTINEDDITMISLDSSVTSNQNQTLNLDESIDTESSDNSKMNPKDQITFKKITSDSVSSTPKKKNPSSASISSPSPSSSLKPTQKLSSSSSSSSSFVSKKITEVKKVWEVQCENLLNKIGLNNSNNNNDDKKKSNEKSVFWSRESMSIIDNCNNIAEDILNLDIKLKLQNINEKAKSGELSHNDYLMMNRVYNIIKAKTN